MPALVRAVQSSCFLVRVGAVNDDEAVTVRQGAVFQPRVEHAGHQLRNRELPFVDSVEIDAINILRATHKAMRAALAGLAIQPQHVLIDGLPVFPFPLPQTAIIDGDCYSLTIAAASVIAKVTRDAIMRDFCARFPEYCFSQHKGYGTELHLIKLHEHGPCPIHRRSFEPVAQPVFDFASPAFADWRAGGEPGLPVPAEERLQNPVS